MSNLSPTSLPAEDRALPETTEALMSFAASATPEKIEATLRQGAEDWKELRPLCLPPDADRIAAGYGHTLREIAQQPFLWADTAQRANTFIQAELAPLLESGAIGSIALVGSGSSHYVGELVAPALRAHLGLPVTAVPAGDILTHGRMALPAKGPLLLISIARSGNSPESLAAVRIAAREAPETRFLHITCNAEGTLARAEAGDPPAHRLLLHPLSNDRSLVMTSSFTNLALAALATGYANAPAEYLGQAQRLCQRGSESFAQRLKFAMLLPWSDCRRAVFLGSGCQHGAAREAALKLTEMTAGGVVAMAETHLGLRHGPMAAIHPDTLIVSFTPPGPRAAPYAQDLIAELRAKGLGRAIVLLAGGESPALSGEPEAAPSPTALRPIGEAFAAIENVVLGQTLGLVACLEHGLSPDAPSQGGVITRVVPPFPIYNRAAASDHHESGQTA